MNEVLVVPSERSGIELDEFLALQFPGWTKGFIRGEVRAGRVLVNGIPARPSDRLRSNAVVMLDVDESQAPAAPVVPEAEIRVLHEEPGWMVISKPAGLAVEPERWFRENGCLSGALLQFARDRVGSGEALEHRFRIVHRLDKETSGALLVAKDVEAERFLRRAFENRTVRKIYFALVEGESPLRDGEHEEIDLAIRPDERKSGRMVVVDSHSNRGTKGGKESRTRISIQMRFRGYTLMRCEPLTGRTHQIRVHLAAIGFPLAVDRLYGRRNELMLSSIKTSYRAKKGRPERPLIERITLHAAELGVPRPDGEPVRVEAPLPKDFANLLKQLRKHRSLSS